MKTTLLCMTTLVIVSVPINKVYSQTELQAQRATSKYDELKLATLAVESRISTQNKIQAAMRAGFRMTFEVKGGEDAAGPGYFAKLQSLTADGKPIYYRTLK